MAITQASISLSGVLAGPDIQNDITLRDRTKNLAVVGRQPQTSPNYASYSPGGRSHCMAEVFPSASGEVSDAPLGLSELPSFFLLSGL